MNFRSGMAQMVPSLSVILLPKGTTQGVKALHLESFSIQAT